MNFRKRANRRGKRALISQGTTSQRARERSADLMPQTRGFAKTHEKEFSAFSSREKQCNY
eukprot:scaffold153541_cov33-Tisochrysis_lutea.AAC.1